VSEVATALVPLILLAVPALLLVAYRYPSTYSRLWPRLFIGGIVAFLLVLARNDGVQSAEAAAIASLAGLDVAAVVERAIRSVRIDLTLPMLALLGWIVFVVVLANLPEILGRDRGEIERRP